MPFGNSRSPVLNSWTSGAVIFTLTRSFSVKNDSIFSTFLAGPVYSSGSFRSALLHEAAPKIMQVRKSRILPLKRKGRNVLVAEGRLIKFPLNKPLIVESDPKVNFEVVFFE